MNKIHLIICFIFIILSSCQNSDKTIESQKATKESIINVQASNRSQKNIYTYFDQSGYRKFDINTDQFSFPIIQSIPQISRLAIGNAEINFYLAPGDTVNLNFSENDIINGFGHKFNGTNSEINNFIASIDKILKHQNNSSFSYFFNCEPSSFIQKMDSIQAICFSSLKSFVTKHRSAFDKNTLELIDNYIKYKIGLYYLKYPNYYEYAFMKGSIDTKKLNETLESKVLNQVKMGLNNVSYLDFIYAQVINTTTTIFNKSNYDKGTNNHPELDIYFYVIDSLFKNESNQEYLKFFTLQLAYFRRVQSFPNFSSKFIASFPKSKYRESISDMQYELDRSILSKNLYDKYDFYDMNNSKRSLSEFKNKVLYIDFWATWCGPCMDQMKFLNEVANQFQDEDNIAILCISLDEKNNFQKWGKTVQIKEIEGEHWIVNNAFDSDICKDFRIRGIPRYMIFYKDGSLFDSNAIPPSDDRIVKVLNRLLTD